jgi:hypothetical protein
MPQLTGPVGPAPINSYLTTDQYEKDQAAYKAAEEQQTQKVAAQQGEVGPKTVNPLQGLIEAGGGALPQALQQAMDMMSIPGLAVEKAADAVGLKPVAESIRESKRVASDILLGSVESVIDTADLIGDVTKVGISKATGTKVKPTENPWSDRYTAAATSFGLEKPKTQIGQIASKIGQFVMVTKAAATMAPKALIQLGTKGVGLRGAIASGLVPGAVADFMLTKPGDGNFSEMVKSFVPEDNPLHNSFLFALATDKTDDVFTAKLKGTLEGGVFGSTVDGLGWLMFGRKTAQAALKAGDPETVAVAKGLEASQQAMKMADKANVKDIQKEAVRWGDVHAAELEDLLNTERKLMDQEAALKASGIPDDAPQAVALKETLADARQAQAELDERIANGYNPNDAERFLPQDAAATVKEGDPAKAIGDQHQSFGASGTKVDIKDYTSNVRGATHMMTDAQFRLQNITGSTEDLVRSVSKRFELQDAAREARDSVDNIIKAAAEDLDNFRNALGTSADNETLLSMMKQAELIDPEHTSNKLLSKKGVLVTKALVRDTAIQINEIATNAAALREAGEMPGNTIDRLTDRLVTLLELHKYSAYKAGSYLQNFKNAVGVDQLDEAGAASKFERTNQELKEWAINIKKLQRSNDPKAADELDAFIRSMLLAGGDPTLSVKFWDAARGIGFKQAATGLYQSILSGPITHLRNIFGNTYSMLERPFSTYLQGVVGQDKALRASAVSGLHGMATGLQDAWQIALTTLKTGDSVNFNHKFAIEDFETRAMLEQMDLAAKTDGEKTAVGMLYNHYHFLNNPWLSWPSRSLMAGDDFFKSLAARYRMNSKSMYEAISHSADESDVDVLFKKYMDNYSKGIDPQTGRIVDPDLLDYAERITFQNDPGSWINSVANAVDQAPLGIGKLFIPFIRTPANLMGYGLEHVPGIHKVIRSLGDTLEAAEKNGDHLLVAEIRGRQATGAMILGSMVTMGMMTDITGNLPYDAAERAAWKEEGRPPMSIRVGNKWVSYASLEPINSMLSIVADAMRLVKIGGADAASQIMRQTLYSFMAAYTDKSMLAGLSTLGQMMDPKTLSSPSGMNFLLNTVNNLTPYAGARRALSNALDPYLKETRGELDRMLVAAAPGFGTDLPSVTSWATGKKLTSVAGGIYNALSPIRIYDVNNNVVVKNLTEIKFPSNSVLKSGQNGIPLQPQSRERLAQILYQSGLPKELEKLFKDPAWQAMAKAWKGRTIPPEVMLGDKEDTPDHIKAVRKIISAYKDNALNVLFQEDPVYRSQIFQAKDERVRSSRGDFRATKSEEFLQFANAPKPN